VTEVIRLERVRLKVNSDPKKYATEHFSIFRWSGERGGNFHFWYQRRFRGGEAEIGVEAREVSSESDSESYQIVEASSDPRPPSTATRLGDGAPGVGDSERVARSVVCWKGDGTTSSLRDSLRVFRVRICPSFSILCSNTDHSGFGEDWLKGAKIVPGLVRVALFPLRRGDTDEEKIRLPNLERVGRGCPSVFGGEVPGVFVLPLKPTGFDVDASSGR
jgi:hypothetical protein